jgi:hypothetical protein
MKAEIKTTGAKLIDDIKNIKSHPSINVIHYNGVECKIITAALTRFPSLLH